MNVARAAGRRPAPAAVIDVLNGRSVTFGALLDGARQLSAGLAGRGIGRGDVVSIVAANGVDYPAALYGSLAAGASVASSNPALTPFELARQFRLTRPKLVFADAQSRAAVREALADGGSAAALCALDGGQGDLTLADLLAGSGAATSSRDPLDLALLFPSSGTTGLPKVVAHTHASATAFLAALAAAPSARWTEADVVADIVPFTHLYGTALRLVMSGAAPCAAAPQDEVEARLGCRVVDLLGSTEAWCATPPAEPAVRGSVGIVGANMEAAIVDVETGAWLGANEPGELWLRGPQVMRGYLSDEPGAGGLRRAATPRRSHRADRLAGGPSGALEARRRRGVRRPGAAQPDRQDPAPRADRARAGRGRVSGHAAFDRVDGSADPSGLVAYLDAAKDLPIMRKLGRLLIAELRLGPGGSVLDVGCGTGADAPAMAAAVAPGGRVVGIDASTRMVVEARRRSAAGGSPVEFRVGRAERLDLPAGRFDACRFERVLQHLTSPAAALRETARVLRPGGQVAALEPDWRRLELTGADPRLTRRVPDVRLRSIPHPEFHLDTGQQDARRRHRQTEGSNSSSVRMASDPAAICSNPPSTSPASNRRYPSATATMSGVERARPASASMAVPSSTWPTSCSTLARARCPIQSTASGSWRLTATPRRSSSSASIGRPRANRPHARMVSMRLARPG